MTSSKKPGEKRPVVKVSKTKQDDFVSVAHRLECDEDKGRFEKKLGKIAKAKVAPRA
jgi:hypothetical protein